MAVIYNCSMLRANDSLTEKYCAVILKRVDTNCRLRRIMKVGWFLRYSRFTSLDSREKWSNIWIRCYFTMLSCRIQSISCFRGTWIWREMWNRWLEGSRSKGSIRTGM